MISNNSLMIVSIILILISVVLVIVFWDDIFTPYIPSVGEDHHKKCDEIHTLFDKFGIPRDSAVRTIASGPACDDLNLCPISYRPKASPSPCEDNLVLGKNTHGDDCCVFPPPLKRHTKKTAGDQVEDLIKDNLIMDVFILHAILKKIDKMINGGRISKALQKKWFPDYKPKYFTEAAEEAAEKGGRLSRVKDAATKVKGAAKEAVEAAGKEEGLGKILKNLTKHIGEKCCGAMARKLESMIVLSSVAGVGEVLDAIMMGGMAMDMFGIGAYRQYQDNKYTYLSMRDATEGHILSAYKKIGKEPPFYFTLDTLSRKDLDLSKDTTPEGISLNNIATQYSNANLSYTAWSLSEGMKKLEGDKDHFEAAIQEALAGNTPNISEAFIKIVSDAFHEDPVARDKRLYDYMAARVGQADMEYVRYDQDTDHMSSEKCYGITFSPKGVLLWNDYVSKHYGASLPMIVESSYYRYLPDGGERDGIKNDPTTMHQKGDKGGVKKAVGAGDKPEIVYSLKTKKIMNTKNEVVSWPQVSYTRATIEPKCKHGMHLPSSANMLSTMGDKKLCSLTNTPKCVAGRDGGTDKDGNACKLNDEDDPSNCASTDDNGHPTGDCVFHGYIPGKCTSSDPSKAGDAAEYGMNGILCRVNGFTWTPAKCGEIHNDGVIGGGGCYNPDKVTHLDYDNKADCLDNKATNYWKDGPMLDRGVTLAGNALNHIGNHSDDKVTGYAPLTTAVATKLGTMAFGSAARVMFIVGDSDSLPENHGVTYNEDTGICNYTEDWCSRMGLGLKDNDAGYPSAIGVPATNSLHDDQVLPNCVEGETQEFFEEFLGKSITRTFLHPIAALDGAVEQAEGLVKEAVTAGKDVMDFVTGGGSGSLFGSGGFVEHPIDRGKIFFEKTLPGWFS